MKKYTPLFLVQLLFSSSLLLGCHRRPFHHKDRTIAPAETWIKNRYRKPASELCLYDLLEAITDEFTLFFDSASNKESFEKHVRRMAAFVPLLQSRISSYEIIKDDFEEHVAEYQTQFGKMMDVDTFSVMIKEIVIFYTSMCEDLLIQINKRSSWQVCAIFYKFYKKLPMSFLKGVTHISNANFSKYWMFRTIRWRLNLRDQ